MKIPALRPPRGFQFRLGTLFIAIVWVALVCMGLRTASEPWSGILFILSTGSVLLAALMSIYRTGRTRAFALGYLICGGVYLEFAGNEQNYDDPSTARPSLTTTNWSIALYSRIHGDSVQTTTQSIAAPVSAPPSTWAVAPAATYQVVSQTETIVAGTPPSAGAAPPPPTETPASTVLPYRPVISSIPVRIVTRTIQSQTVSLSAFLSVAHNSLLMLLGLIGGITAQYLHATRRDDESTGRDLAQRHGGTEEQAT